MIILYILSKYTNKQFKKKQTNKMKKIALVLLASATILTSCGGSTEKTETTTTDSTAVAVDSTATPCDSCATLSVDTTSTSVAK